MIKILSAQQIKEADQHTINHEPISSINLMERAAFSLISDPVFPHRDHSFYIFCGPGNNGGDGLALARIMMRDGYRDVSVFILADTEKYSEEFKLNEARLDESGDVKVSYLKTENDFLLPKESGTETEKQASTVIIDALFGSGLNKPLSGLAEALINYLNHLNEVIRIAIDIPSGLYADRSADGVVFNAEYTLTFQQPKLSFLFPENSKYTGEWRVTDIGLDKSFIAKLPCSEFLTEETDVIKILRTRNKFDHKGKFGHAFIYAGSNGKMGACIIAAKACARSGAGLTRVLIPKGQSAVLNISIPECMTEEYTDAGSIDIRISKHNAFAFGPGIGTSAKAKNIFLSILKQLESPAVIDADALNILSAEKKGLALIPKYSILTPHPKEFERLAGVTNSWDERHRRQIELSKKFSIYIILKGAYTCISTPTGKCYFNPTGNAGMAKGGTGDMLTGMLAGLLAQGYSPEETCILGVYLHGLSADIAVRKKSVYSLLATDMIFKLGNAFQKISSFH